MYIKHFILTETIKCYQDGKACKSNKFHILFFWPKAQSLKHFIRKSLRVISYYNESLYIEVYYEINLVLDFRNVLAFGFGLSALGFRLWAFGLKRLRIRIITCACFKNGIFQRTETE